MLCFVMDPNMQALEEQKNNCIFCKIIAGEVPSRKVYEDDLLIAVLDINPATLGHVLVIPKEHYPILPVIPFAETQKMFNRTQDIIKAMKTGLLCKGVTLLIANGAVAGQQSPHFLFHLIPRDDGDGLGNFTIPSGAGQSENDNVVYAIQPKIAGLMQAYAHEMGRSNVVNTAAASVQGTASNTVSSAGVGGQNLGIHAQGGSEGGNDQSSAATDASVNANASSNSVPVTEEKLNALIETINSNPQLREALIHRVDEVKDAVKTIPKWKELFEGVDIDQLSNNLKAIALTKMKEGNDQDKSNGSNGPGAEASTPVPTPNTSSQPNENRPQATTPSQDSGKADLDKISNLFT